ncbi:hypothetical protein GCHA_3864 [Paraglaciecola chathamensis S18K6]|uniref:Uncharacterized protein n=1 Tax=Paraglaciecola chathamensis S18K6 TaxID=1127672 RepID=A0AAV3V4P9_9ALTE|nr:hypothetical protein GCHA_3864 [Paraglaciecola chathamensis S18K6]
MLCPIKSQNKQYLAKHRLFSSIIVIDYNNYFYLTIDIIYIFRYLH